LRKVQIKERVNTFKREEGINYMPKVTGPTTPAVVDHSMMKGGMFRESQESRYSSTLQAEKELTLPSALEKPTTVKNKFNFKAPRRINI
jgi:hypothetical protein